MAKRKRTTKSNPPSRSSSTRTKKPTTPNLFHKAAEKQADEPKKKPNGTIFLLPTELDGEGQLCGESKELNESIATVIDASADEKTAKNKSSVAKGILNKHTHRAFVEKFAELGIQPPGPMKVVNHLGASLTYVVVDKSQQYELDKDQIELIEDVIGKERTAEIIVKQGTFRFDPEVMGQLSKDKESKVMKVVAELVSEAIFTSKLLTEDQKSSLIEAEEKTRLRPGTIQRLATICKGEKDKMEDLLAAFGSSVSRYHKA